MNLAKLYNLRSTKNKNSNSTSTDNFPSISGTAILTPIGHSTEKLASSSETSSVETQYNDLITTLLPADSSNSDSSSTHSSAIMDTTLATLYDGSDPLRINALPLPTFLPGTDNAQDFLEKYIHIANCNGFNDKLKLRFFRNSLKGSALNFYDILAANSPESTWVDVQKEFTNQFSEGSNRLNLFFKLSNMRQQENESIRDYFLNTVALCLKVNIKMAEEDKINYVLNGMLPKYQEKILLNVEATPSLDSIEKLVLSLQAAENRMKLCEARFTSDNSNHIQNIIADVLLRQDKVERQLEQRQQSVPLNNTPQNVRHEVKNPPFSPSTFNRQPNNRTYDGRPICFRCNKQGHMAVNCFSNINNPRPNFNSNRNSFANQSRGNFRERPQNTYNRPQFQRPPHPTNTVNFGAYNNTYSPPPPFSERNANDREYNMDHLHNGDNMAQTYAYRRY